MAKELTFAEQANKIKNKYKRGLENNDVFSTRAYKREMDRLIQEQEDFKAKNNLQEPAPQESMQQFSKGGDLNARLAAERNRLGRDMSNAEVRAYLGKDYNTWEEWAKPLADKARGSNEGATDFSKLIYGDRFANLKDAPDANTVQSYEPTDRSYMMNPNYVPYKTNPLYDIASTGLTVAGQLARDKASPVNFDRVGANYVNYDPARRDIKQQIDEGRIDALNSIRGAGGTRGQQLRAMQGVSNGLSANEARALNESYMQQYNQNAGIRSQADAMNADIGARETMQNYADKRYVLENNDRRNTKIANTLSQLPQQLKANKFGDMQWNTDSTKYGLDASGNIVNKQIPISTTPDLPMKNQAIRANSFPTTNIRSTGLSSKPTILPRGDYRISPEDAIYNNELEANRNKVTEDFYSDAYNTKMYAKGGKIKKYKCGGKLRKK